MTTRKVPSYDLSVFLNCPFDDAYKSLLDAIVFAVHDCGFFVRIALEDVGGTNRLNKLLEIISKSRFSIHDLSRIQEPRLNMTFECGVVFGAMHFGTPRQRQKDLLLLDAEDHQYKKTMSDVSGQDGAVHHNDPYQAIACVRSFLARKSGQPMRGHEAIGQRYARFLDDLPAISQKAQISVAEFRMFNYLPDLMTVMIQWIARTP